MAATNNAAIDPTIASKVNEIKALPYAKSIVAEDVIERNFGYKIIRQQVSSGRNSMIYKCESAKRAEVYCLVKAYKLGREKVKTTLKEEVCQILLYVTGKCPQVISTYDIYYTDEKIYLMCDWAAKGEVLTNLRNRNLKFNEEMLRNWTTDIISAVNFLHNHGICHRNIAPSCLLLTNENRVKIGTLSDAVIYTKPDGTLIKQKWGRFSRTANWNQAPEVAKGKLYDPRRADIWSIGATIYWFITRNHPIEYRPGARMAKQLDHKLSLMRKVSSKCQAFVKKMLTFQPSLRPTIGQAGEHEWFTAVPATGTSVSAKAKEAEISTSEKAEPGEAAGPDEVSPEPEPSTSKQEKEPTQNNDEGTT